ncbi:MAG: RtcB family protein, partial [Bacteroidales bacterium]
QLCCAPIRSPEGKAYLAAMAAAANFAFANRQVMSHWVRESFAAALGVAPDRTGLEVVYDVCHNIAKFETFPIDGRSRRVCVHRKGATRAYPPGHPQTPEAYRAVGQPVLIPGDMGRYSYVLAGTARAFTESFGSTCHGAGRRMSRSEAKRAVKPRAVIDDLKARGVHLMAAGMSTIAEEMPEAYKDVADVVAVVDGAGLSTRVAQLRPIGVIKG